MMKRLKKILRFIANPRLLMCVLIAWLITNGWAYIFLAIGNYFSIRWMIVLSSGYLAFLWLPVSPEKLLTFTIALLLLKFLFPNDQKTLAVLKSAYAKCRQTFKKRKRHREDEGAF